MKTTTYTLKYIETPAYDSTKLTHHDFLIWNNEDDFYIREELEFETKEEAEQKLKELSEKENSFSFKGWSVSFSFWAAEYITTTYEGNEERKTNIIDVEEDRNSYETTTIKEAIEFTKLKEHWEEKYEKISDLYSDDEITKEEYNKYYEEYQKAENEAHDKYGNWLNIWD